MDKQTDRTKTICPQSFDLGYKNPAGPNHLIYCFTVLVLGLKKWQLPPYPFDYYSIMCLFQILFIPKFSVIRTNCLVRRYFYHLLHTKLPYVFRILYILNSEHKIQSLEYIIAEFDTLYSDQYILIWPKLKVPKCLFGHLNRLLLCQGVAITVLLIIIHQSFVYVH